MSSCQSVGTSQGLAKRVIACLDVRANDAGDLVVTKGDQYDVRDKGTTANDVRNLGLPVQLAGRYFMEGADEVTFLNITGFRDFPLGDLPMLEVIVSCLVLVVAFEVMLHPQIPWHLNVMHTAGVHAKNGSYSMMHNANCFCTDTIFEPLANCCQLLCAIFVIWVCAICTIFEVKSLVWCRLSGKQVRVSLYP